ncbi:copper transporter [Syntrophomonas curvata]
MIDLKYHITSIVAIFLALGLGVLIGSSIVGDNLLVDQQKKMIDRLEEQFYVLRDKEDKLEADNEYKTNIISNYENYSQTVLPLLVEGRLKGYKAAVVVTGDSEVPAGMANALSNSGAEVVSQIILLSNMNLESPELRSRLINFYNLDGKTSRDTLRHYVAVSVAAILNGIDEPGLVTFLEQNNLIKFSGNNRVPLNGVVLLGGANNLNSYFAESFDQGLVSYFNEKGIKVYGVEQSQVAYSYMSVYQNNNISTVDNIDLSPGQISLVLAMEGEAGDYGMKPTAKKFMPSLLVDNPGER